MNKPQIEVGEVRIAELRLGLRRVLELNQPMIVRRRDRPVAVLLAVETSYFGSLEKPRTQKARLLADLEAVFRKLARS